jgi:ecotin
VAAISTKGTDMKRVIIVMVVLAAGLCAVAMSQQGGGNTSAPASAPAINPEAQRNMKAYPPAGAGQARYVVLPPKQNDESSFKVELVVGKTVLVDGVNKYFFTGKIEEKMIEGWGFPRYNVGEVGQMAGTMMAPDPNAPKVNRFVPLGGEPYLLRYNSRLPIVVYVPEGVEVRYRIWSIEAEAKSVEKG